MAYLVNKHNSYYAVFGINGKKKWIKIGNVDKKDAKKALKLLEIEHLKTRLNISDPQNILLFDFIEEYLSFSKVNKSYNTYRLEKGISKPLRAIIGNILLRTIDTKIIERYKVNRISQGLKPASVNRELGLIRYMLKIARDRNYIDDLPRFKQLKVPNVPVKFLSVDEIERLIDCSSVWLKPILIVLRNTGMRMGEVLNLKLGDIDLENGVLLARSTKTNNFRLIPINEELQGTLKWLTENYMNPRNMLTNKRTYDKNSYLFSHSDGARIKSIKTSFNNACKRAGIDATVHTIRHSFASHLVMNGVDLVSVKELLGHTSIKTTMIYAHVSTDHMHVTVEKLPWVK